MASRIRGLTIVVGASALLALLTGCGDDASPGGGGAGGSGGDGATSSTTSATSSTGGVTTSAGGGGGTGQGGSGEGGGDGTIACGDLTCSAGEACVETVIEPSCTPLDEGAACPDGTTESHCGGAGLPCCCEPPPEPERGCVDAPACGGAPPTCACIDPCDGDAMCTDGDSPGRVVCEPLPKP